MAKNNADDDTEDEDFFGLLRAYQRRRVRAVSGRPVANSASPPLVSSQPHRINGTPSSPLVRPEGLRALQNSEGEEQHELGASKHSGSQIADLDGVLDLLINSQARRLNDQRAPLGVESPMDAVTEPLEESNVTTPAEVKATMKNTSAVTMTVEDVKKSIAATATVITANATAVALSPAQTQPSPAKSTTSSQDGAWVKSNKRPTSRVIMVLNEELMEDDV